MVSYLYRMGTNQNAKKASDIPALKQDCPRSPVRQEGCVSDCSTYRTPELIWHMFRCTLNSFYCDKLGFVEEATEHL